MFSGVLQQKIYDVIACTNWRDMQLKEGNRVLYAGEQHIILTKHFNQMVRSIKVY